MLAVLCAALSSTGAAMKRGSYRLHDVFTVEHDTEADLVEEFLSNSDVRSPFRWLTSPVLSTFGTSRFSSSYLKFELQSKPAISLMVSFHAGKT